MAQPSSKKMTTLEIEHTAETTLEGHIGTDAGTIKFLISGPPISLIQSVRVELQDAVINWVKSKPDG